MRFEVGAVGVELLDAGDRICMSVASGKPFEPETLVVWADLCRQAAADKRMILDVGAYTGLFAIAAALHGCHAIAFEPMPPNADRLALNAKANQVAGEIVTFRGAVADKVGATELTYNPNVTGLTSGASLIRRTGSKLSVKVTTIDAIALPPLEVGAIKIDVERGEPAVLAGAKSTIARCRPAILLEVLDDERKAAVRQALPGYRIAAELDGRNWLMLPS